MSLGSDSSRGGRGGRAGRAAAVLALAATVLVALPACGISGEHKPVAVGSGLPAAPGSVDPLDRPSPNEAVSDEDLIDRYFRAAVGGGDDALDNVRQFMTGRLKLTWKPVSPQLTVVRVLERRRDLPVGDVTPFTVTYQPIGVLTESGYVDELPDQPPVTATFNVTADPNSSTQLRLDSAPSQMLISDDALSDSSANPYYRAQPIYFWDRTNRWLVPDIRYVPLTLELQQRTEQLVQWLVRGPSPWLGPAVAGLPNRTALKSPVVKRGTFFVVNLSAQAVDKPDSLQRLAYQLQWSLRTGSGAPDIEVQIEGQRQYTTDSGGEQEYLKFNAAAASSAALRFHIKDRVVSAEAPAQEVPPTVSTLLSSGANKNVVAAAVSVTQQLGAFVRHSPNGTGTVRITGQVDSKAVDRSVALPAAVSGRPAWVPGTKDTLLVVAGGRLYAITSNGVRSDITPELVGTVQVAAIAPDGRRIAMVADDRAFVSALVYDGGSIHIGDQRRPLLPRQVTAPAAVAWESQDRVLLVGRGPVANAPLAGALWRVTADGVVAENYSGRLRGAVPSDVVAHPSEPGSLASREVTLITDRGVGRLVGNDFTVENKLATVFYAT